MADELIDILNENGKLTGITELKSVAHKKGLWHASVQIWIYTPNGEVLLQKRASNKDTYPDLWDISVAGHLSAGDTPITAAIREIKEEIGIRINADQFVFLKRKKVAKRPSELIIDNEFNYLYLVNYPIKIKDLTLQNEEVAEVKLLSLLEFKNDLETNTNSYVPHGRKYYQYIIDCIQTNLSI